MKKLILGVLLLSCYQPAFTQEIERKGIVYTIADHTEESFIIKQYGQLMDSLLHQPVYGYFRDTSIRNLPKKANRKNVAGRYMIEPLFIDLSTFNGVYAMRIWPTNTKTPSIKFRCGLFHFLFIIAENRYYPLSGDTLKNTRLIDRLFQNRFNPGEVSQMKEYFKQGIICDHNTILPAIYIKEDENILFDAKKVTKQKELDDQTGGN